MLAAPGAVLLQFDAPRVVALVLCAVVIALLTLRTLERDQDAILLLSHDWFPHFGSRGGLRGRPYYKRYKFTG